MTKTLILLFHRDLSASKANAALAAAATKLPDVEIVDMQSVYPDGVDMFRDGEREADRHAPPGHGIVLLADDVSQRQQRDDAESGLKLQHGTHQPVKPASQSEARSMPGSSTAARRGRTYPRPGFRCDPDVTGPGNFPQRPCRG